MDKYSLLKDHFGYSHFRPGQEKLIDGILAGQDVLGVMPTGGGKSMCYQIPALLMDGVTLVISPLISLMKDQVSALQRVGVRAAFLNSSLTGEQLRTVYRNMAQGAYQILYVAPERLEGEGFAALIQQLRVALVAVDEAHCISQWGQDFRPSYGKIAAFVQSLPRRPVVAAFTATATPRVQEDICRLLELRHPLSLVTGFDRPNLFFDVKNPQDKTAALFSLVGERRDKCGIVYCATRSTVESVCQALVNKGIGATRYHAGLSEEERRCNQEDFQFDRKSVMVATNAFGMGIDKSNVSYVIHYNMPKSLEAYYQEAGRAGRDGENADCILLYSPRDIVTAKFLIGKGSGELTEEEREEVRRGDRERLRAMIGYCRTTHCLRGYLLDYFGQDHGDKCGRCGNCLGEYVWQDITIPAQMILSCICRIRDRLGYYVGKTRVIQVLRGSQDRNLLEWGLEGLSTYGLMKKNSLGQMHAFLDFLELEGYLRFNPLHSTLELTEKSREVLFKGEKVHMPVRKDHRPAEEKTRRQHRASSAGQEQEELYQKLRDLRTRLAQKEKVPAYVVFSNATLADMAAREPGTMEEFLEVSGVGKVKAARYGEEFLRVIEAYRKRQ